MRHQTRPSSKPATCLSAETGVGHDVYETIYNDEVADYYTLPSAGEQATSELTNAVRESELQTLLELLQFLFPNKVPDLMARQLISQFKTLPRILNMTDSDFYPPTADSVRILKFFRNIRELLCISLRQQGNELIHLDDSEALRKYLIFSLAHRSYEELRILYVNSRNRLVLDDLHRSGDADFVSIYPKEIITNAVKLGAKSIIIVHNHPCGNPNPSDDDIETTRCVRRTLWSVGIRLIDHIIVGSDGLVSLRKIEGWT